MYLAWLPHKQHLHDPCNLYASEELMFEACLCKWICLCVVVQPICLKWPRICNVSLIAFIYHFVPFHLFSIIWINFCIILKNPWLWRASTRRKKISLVFAHAFVSVLTFFDRNPQTTCFAASHLAEHVTDSLDCDMLQVKIPGKHLVIWWQFSQQHARLVIT